MSPVREDRDCSPESPTRKQLDYLEMLAQRQRWTLAPAESCCRLHASQTIAMLKARLKPHGWNRRSRAGTKRNRQGY
jgi:hypothetical protein